MESMENYIKKAGILIEALPYIQRLSGKTVVIKYGGNAMISEELKNSVMEDVTLLKYVGINPILIHGGGPDISAALKTYQIESKFVNGLRVTDRETMQVAQMVLAGKTNKEIVALMNQKGGKAVGICGIDGRLIECKKHQVDLNGESEDIGFVGDITRINDRMLKFISGDEYIPVIAPVGVDENGQSYNINADTVASAVAKAVHAEKLILLTDIEGVKIENKVAFELKRQQVFDYIESGEIAGGMIPKVLGCVDALDAGVNRVHIIDGRIPHSIVLEIFTDTGIGTMITADDEARQSGYLMDKSGGDGF